MNPNAEQFVKLMDEMIHLKIQQELDATKKPTPEIARMLHQKQIADQSRLEQVKIELARLLSGGS